MKVLLHHGLPFSLAHGGGQTQVEETRRGLEAAGIETEWLRWWDGTQRGDLIHAFAPVEIPFLRLAAERALPVVLTTLLTDECNHLPAQLRAKRRKVDLLRLLPGFGGVNGLLPWNSFHECTLNVVGLEAEARVLRDVYGVPAARVAVVPLGLPDAYLGVEPASRDGDFLLCSGTITARKRSVDLARLALAARTPVLFVGKPYAEEDPYWAEFRALVDGQLVRHQPHVGSVAEMIALYRRARGFVILSDIENWCLSAHEAAACGLPVLLRPLPWATERFGGAGTGARFFDAQLPDRHAADLREFYEAAPSLPVPRVAHLPWAAVGEQLRGIFLGLLGG